MWCNSCYILVLKTFFNLQLPAFRLFYPAHSFALNFSMFALGHCVFFGLEHVSSSLSTLCPGAHVMMYPGSYFGALRNTLSSCVHRIFLHVLVHWLYKRGPKHTELLWVLPGRTAFPTSGHLPAVLFFTKLTAMSLPVCSTWNLSTSFLKWK